MIKHIWSVICSKSSIDKETNNVSLFEVLEQLNFLVELPKEKSEEMLDPKMQLVVPFNFEIVSLFESEPLKNDISADLKIGIIDPNGKTLQSMNNVFVFQAGKRRMRIAMKINGMPVTTSGIYHVVVMLKQSGLKDYKIVSELPLETSVNRR